MIENPFVTNGYAGPDYFCDRVEETAMLAQNATVSNSGKIDVMRGAEDPIMELALDLSSRLHAEIVQVVGKVIVLYRKNKENPKIKLKK